MLVPAVVEGAAYWQPSRATATPQLVVLKSTQTSGQFSIYVKPVGPPISCGASSVPNSHVANAALTSALAPSTREARLRGAAGLLLTVHVSASAQIDGGALPVSRQCQEASPCEGIVPYHPSCISWWMRPILRATDHPPISVIFTDIQLGGSVTGWNVAEAFRQALPTFQ